MDTGRKGLAAVCRALVKQRVHVLLRSGLMQVALACGASDAVSVLRSVEGAAKIDALSLMFLTSDQGSASIDFD